MVFGLGLGRTLIFSTILGFRQFYVDGLSVGELFFFFNSFNIFVVNATPKHYITRGGKILTAIMLLFF